MLNHRAKCPVAWHEENQRAEAQRHDCLCVDDSDQRGGEESGVASKEGVVVLAGLGEIFGAEYDPADHDEEHDDESIEGEFDAGGALCFIEEAIDDEPEAVEHAPDDECPVCPVPEPGEQEDEDEVSVGEEFGAV